MQQFRQMPATKVLSKKQMLKKREAAKKARELKQKEIFRI